MKIKISLLHSPSLTGLTSCILVAPVLAQQTTVTAPDEAQMARWEKLEKVNAPIKECHVVWHRVQRIAAQPDNDPEKQAQGMMESARKQGMEEKKVLELGEMERKHALSSRKERVIESTLDFVRIGNTVLCNANLPAPEYKFDYLEYSDGINSLYAQTTSAGKPRKHVGTALLRKPDEVLRMSAGGSQIARFLVGIPLDQSFGPQNPELSREAAQMQVLSDGKWVVERKARIVDRQTVEPDELTFGGSGSYLTAYEKFGISMTIDGKKMTMNKSGTQKKVVASDFKKYAGGIWFPSQIIAKSGNMTTQYTLISAQFNEDVNPLGLSLPPNLSVTDLRFGERGGNTPVYKTTNGRLLTDEQVKAQLGMN